MMSPSDVTAFQDWQRLDPKEKEALIWLAKNHPAIMSIVNAARWFGQTWWAVTKVGVLASIILGLIALYSHFGAKP